MREVITQNVTQELIGQVDYKHNAHNDIASGNKVEKKVKSTRKADPIKSLLSTACFALLSILTDVRSAEAQIPVPVPPIELPVTKNLQTREKSDDKKQKKDSPDCVGLQINFHMTGDGGSNDIVKARTRQYYNCQNGRDAYNNITSMYFVIEKELYLHRGEYDKESIRDIQKGKKLLGSFLIKIARNNGGDGFCASDVIAPMRFPGGLDVELWSSNKAVGCIHSQRKPATKIDKNMGNIPNN